MEANGAIPNTGAEAPCSWNVKYRSAEGFDCMLTLRGGSGAEVLRAADKAVTWLSEHGATPDGYRAQSAPAAPAGPTTADPTWCTIHSAQMKAHSANGETWYSHKVGDTWCRGGKAK